MEHRWCKRSNTRLDVALYQHDVRLAVTRTRNVGIYGLFVDVDAAAPGLEVGGCVKVGFGAREPGALPHCQIAGVIVHRNRQGVGVMFTRHEPQLVNAIGALVGQANPNASQPGR